MTAVLRTICGVDEQVSGIAAKLEAAKYGDGLTRIRVPRMSRAVSAFPNENLH